MNTLAFSNGITFEAFDVLNEEQLLCIEGGWNPFKVLSYVADACSIVSTICAVAFPPAAPAFGALAIVFQAESLLCDILADIDDARNNK